MCNRNTSSIGVIILGIFLFLCAPLCFAQNNYQEIEIYRSLVETEARDSIYHKALAEHRALPTLIASSALQERLSAILSLSENTDSEVIKKTEALEALAQEAFHKKDLSAELSALSEVFNLEFWHEPQNYNKAFVLAVKLKNKLDKVDDTQFSGRRNTYVKLGEAYYIFKDFVKSIELLKDVINKSPLSFGDRSHIDALRISGICYANIPGKMAQSDSCFMAMMLSPYVVLNRPVYDALALSNLGCNAMIQGDFDKALALDQEVLPRLKQEKDYGHIAGMYACQGYCYLGQGDYTKLRMVIDSISTYAHKDHYNHNKRLKQTYTLSSKYYSAVGNAQMAQLYNDSLVAIYQSEEKEYTSQFISDARREVRDQEIELHRQQITGQRSLIVFVLLILVLLSIGTVIITYLYRKRNAAYKALTRKAQEWARERTTPIVLGSELEPDDNTIQEQPVTEEDQHIMSLVEQAMLIGYTYREANLTLDSLADQLGIGRHSLSRAVNRVTGKNFKQYINGYRIKKAVIIISKNKHEYLYIDELYERVGFSNRSTFSRTFKQFTGLSPLEFQKQKNSLVKNSKN